ncbi:MAG: POTRA domain-containing protein [Chitinophagaceae bacterium]
MLIRFLSFICLLLPCSFVVAQFAVSDTTITVPPDDTTLQVFKTVRNIIITGNQRTKGYIVAREIALEMGHSYAANDLAARIKLTKEQLINTSLFVDVDITNSEISKDEVDLTVDVKERWYVFPVPYFKVIDRNWNEWIHTYKASLSRVNYGIKVSENNLSGRNDKLNVWLIGGYTQQISFNYTQPYLDKDLKHGMFMGFLYARNREVNYGTNFDTLQYLKLPNFARTFIDAHVGYTYRRGSKERHSLRLSFSSDKIDSAIIKRNTEFFGNSSLKEQYWDLSYSFQYFNVDYIKYPLRGWYVDVYAFKRFSKTLGLFGIGGKYLHSWKLPVPTSYFALQAAATVKLPFQQSYYNSHLLGYGDLSMRGLEYLVVDGVAGGVLKGTVRKKLFSFTFKNFIKSKSHDRIPFTFYAKAFGDLGYVYSKSQTNNSRLSNKWLHSGGFGIDIVTIYDTVFKIEFSFNQLGSHGIYYHSGSDF